MAYQTAAKYTGTFSAANPSVVTIAIATGSGAGRAIWVMFSRRGDRQTSITSMTIGGEAMTVLGSDVVMPNNANIDVRSAILINPTVEGTQNLVITCVGTGSGAGTDVLVEVMDNVDTGMTPAVTSNTGTTATSSVTQSSATGRQIVTGHIQMSDALGLDGSTPTDFTSRATTYGGGQGFVVGDAAGAASVAMSLEWTDTGSPITGTLGWVAMSTDLPAPAAGGVEDTGERGVQRGVRRGVQRGIVHRMQMVNGIFRPVNLGLSLAGA